MQLERLDLHGSTLHDAVTRFVRKYNWLASNTPPGGETHALDVIHGRGLGKSDAGVIRDTLRDLLRREGKRISGYDAQLVMRGAEYLLDDSGTLAYMHGEDVDRNPGHTIVVPRRRIRLPSEYLR
jgi:hypothetical protein